MIELAVLRVVLCFDASLLCFKRCQVQLDVFTVFISSLDRLLQLHLVMPRVIRQRRFIIYINFRILAVLVHFGVTSELICILGSGCETGYLLLNEYLKLFSYLIGVWTCFDIHFWSLSYAIGLENFL